MANEQVLLLQEKHNTFKSSFPLGFNIAQTAWKKGVEALRKQAVNAENDLDQIRSTNAESVKMLLAKRDAAGAYLYELVAVFPPPKELLTIGKRRKTRHSIRS